MNKTETIGQEITRLLDQITEIEETDHEIRQRNIRSVRRDLGHDKVDDNGHMTLYHSSVMNSKIRKDGHFPKHTLLYAHPDDARKVKTGRKTSLNYRRNVISAHVDLAHVNHHGHGVFSARTESIKPTME